MIYIFCAIKEEAQCLNSILTDDCHLCLTGVGKINAAYSVGKNIGNKTRQEASNDYVINFGCCCSKDLEGAFLVNKITDISSNRDFYPDMIRISSVKEAHLMTSDTLICNPEAGLLYDMEGSGIFESSIKHISPDRIFFVKCVSDSGDFKKVSKDSINKACVQGVSIVKSIIEMIKNMPLIEDEYIPSISKLHLTSTMKSQFEELVRYAKSLNIDIEDFISNEIGDKDNLNKKESLVVLEHVKEYLIS